MSELRNEFERGWMSSGDGAHIGLSDAEISDLVHAYQRIGYFLQELQSGHTYFSSDACAIFGVAATEGPVDLIEISRRLHEDDVGLLACAFETAARAKKGFDLICRIRKDAGEEKFVRMTGRFRASDEEGEIAGLVYEFFEPMRIMDFSDE